MNEHLTAFEEYTTLFKRNLPATSEQLAQFEVKTNLVLPDDLKAYFLSTNGGCDDRMTEFYSLSKFKTVQEEYKDFSGTPDYRDRIINLPEHINCYVFANHSLDISVYAIRLYCFKSDKNEIYSIHDEDLVANSFGEFLHKYISWQVSPWG